jgi:hypothetical protein
VFDLLRSEGWQCGGGHVGVHRFASEISSANIALSRNLSTDRSY